MVLSEVRSRPPLVLGVELPPRKLLTEKLHLAVELARVRLGGKIDEKK